MKVNCKLISELYTLQCITTFIPMSHNLNNSVYLQYMICMIYNIVFICKMHVYKYIYREKEKLCKIYFALHIDAPLCIIINLVFIHQLFDNQQQQLKD